jgi:hypothetical protein
MPAVSTVLRHGNQGRDSEEPELILQYDQAFAEEPQDRGALRIERVAANAVRAVLPEGSQLRTVECRESMCRIETSHQDDKSVGEFFRKLVSAEQSELSDRTYSQLINDHPGSGEPLVCVSYVARNGRELPRL